MGLFDNVYQTPVQTPVYNVPTAQPSSMYLTPGTPGYQPAYQPAYQQDAFGSGLQTIANAVYQLQQTVQQQGAYAANNYTLQSQCNDLITRLGQYQQALSQSGYYNNSPYQPTITDLSARLTQIQTTLRTTPQYQQPVYQQPVYQYPQQPVYPQQPAYQVPPQGYPMGQRPWRHHHHHGGMGNNPMNQIGQIFQGFAGALQQGQQGYYRR